MDLSVDLVKDQISRGGITAAELVARALGANGDRVNAGILESAHVDRRAAGVVIDDRSAVRFRGTVTVCVGILDDIFPSSLLAALKLAVSIVIIAVPYNRVHLIIFGRTRRRCRAVAVHVDGEALGAQIHVIGIDCTKRRHNFHGTHDAHGVAVVCDIVQDLEHAVFGHIAVTASCGIGSAVNIDIVVDKVGADDLYLVAVDDPVIELVAHFEGIGGGTAVEHIQIVALVIELYFQRAVGAVIEPVVFAYDVIPHVVRIGRDLNAVRLNDEVIIIIFIVINGEAVRAFT